ncbi:MAG TPA: periplasmic heavy metal sensor [Cytophagaceae bacterium]|nr:periplasmic heavy metal sensor [Cytophagaceae bacterium]
MKSQKILVAGLILMVLLNICTLGVVLFKSSEDEGPGHHMGMDDKGKHHRGKMIGKRLNFTPEQEAALEKLRAKHDAVMAPLREKMDTLRKQRLALLKADTFDAAKSDQLAAEIGTVQTAIEKEMANHFVEIKALCKKDQLEEYNKFIDRIGQRKFGERRGFGRHGEKEEKDKDQAGPGM